MAKSRSVGKAAGVEGGGATEASVRTVVPAGGHHSEEAGEYETATGRRAACKGEWSVLLLLLLFVVLCCVGVAGLRLMLRDGAVF